MKSVKGTMVAESLNQKSGPKSTKVTYTFFADPEGSLSPSLVYKNILMLIGLKEGLGSSLFGLSFLLACIAIYDRGRMFHIYSYFQKRFPSFKKSVENDLILKDLVGHSVSEIAVGVVIGCATGILVYLFSLQSRG